MSLSSNTSVPTSQTPMLELRNITCGYQPDVPTVQNLTLHLQEGNILCLLGPSGCGKTTTLRAIAGFEKLSAGEIQLKREVLASNSVHLPPEQRRVGMVFQEYALFPHMNVEDNVAFGFIIGRIQTVNPECKPCWT